MGGDQVIIPQEVAVTRPFHLGPKSFQTFYSMATGPVTKACGEPRLEKLFIHLWSLRKTKKVATTVIVKLIDKLGDFPQDIIREGVDVYVRDHPDKDERYLIGICRSELRQRERASGGIAVKHDRGVPVEGLPTAAKHLKAIVLWLRTMYADKRIQSGGKLSIVSSARIIKVLRARCSSDEDCPSATEVDRIATDAEVFVRDNVPKDIDVPWFSPYHI